MDATMRAIYEAVLRLEAALPADSPIRYVQVWGTLTQPVANPVRH